MMKLAERLTHLGTETAFAVSAEAALHAARGCKVYPFHLGDINLPTPELIVQAALAAIRTGKTCYCPTAGIPPLREALAEDISRSHGVCYGMENVAVEPGGKPVIGKFLQAVMEPGDEVLYPNPGYPIYESMIEYYGGRAVPYGFREGEANFEIDLEGLERLVGPRTRVLIFNSPHNPTAAESGPEELERIAGLARRHDLCVLCDEAYFDIRYSGAGRSLVTLPGMTERCLILYTFSKKFAMTGWRLGAAVGPQELIEAIARLNVNDESCSTHFSQYGALAGLTGDPEGPRRILAALKERRDLAVQMLNDIRGVRCYRPESTFYLFPNVTEAMRRKGVGDYNELRTRALEETGVSFCTRLHFGRPLPGETERYLRFAYAGIDTAQIEEGLARLKQFLER
jgi:aspartate/methionine/tyrosine aminotransferase